MAHTLRWSQQMEMIPGDAATPPDTEVTLGRLISFLSGGFRVPAQAAALNQGMNS
jgi:hypothetical protein